MRTFRVLERIFSFECVNFVIYVTYLLLRHGSYPPLTALEAVLIAQTGAVDAIGNKKNQPNFDRNNLRVLYWWAACCGWSSHAAWVLMTKKFTTGLWRFQLLSMFTALDLVWTEEPICISACGEYLTLSRNYAAVFMHGLFWQADLQRPKNQPIEVTVTKGRCSVVRHREDSECSRVIR